MKIKEKYDKVIEYFSRQYPYPETELHHVNPYELIVAVILSAQCTDKRVNQITPAFFKKYPDAVSLSKGKLASVYDLIKSCSYPNNKAKHLIGMAQTLVKKFNNKVPYDIKKLQELPGIGRKSANVIAAVVHNQPTMPVDTHVFRVAARIGLVKNAKTPIHTENQLLKHFPESVLPHAHHWLILHGRYICQARKPKCNMCGLQDICLFYKNLNSYV